MGNPEKYGKEGIVKPIEGDSFLVLLDADNSPVTEPVECRFTWREETGWYSCHMLSQHRISVPDGGAFAVAIVDTVGSIIYAHRGIGSPWTVGQEVLINSDPKPPTANM